MKTPHRFCAQRCCDPSGTQEVCCRSLVQGRICTQVLGHLGDHMARAEDGTLKLRYGVTVDCHFDDCRCAKCAANPEFEGCGAVHAETGLACTQVKGHEFDHVSRGADGWLKAYSFVKTRSTHRYCAQVCCVRIAAPFKMCVADVCGFTCTQTRGHRGDHVTRRNNGELLAEARNEAWGSTEVHTQQCWCALCAPDGWSDQVCLQPDPRSRSGVHWCCLTRGHAGRHLTRNSSGVLLFRWDDKGHWEEPTPQTTCTVIGKYGEVVKQAYEDWQLLTGVKGSPENYAFEVEVGKPVSTEEKAEYSAWVQSVLKRYQGKIVKPRMNEDVFIPVRKPERSFTASEQLLDEAFRFYAGLNLQDQPVAEQRKHRDLLNKIAEFFGKAK